MMKTVYFFIQNDKYKYKNSIVLKSSLTKISLKELKMPYLRKQYSIM